MHGLRFQVAALLTVLLTASAVGQEVDDADMVRDLTVGQKPVFQLGQLFSQKPDAAKFAVDAWADRSPAFYRIGEKLRLRVRPKQNAYITVVDVGSSGKVTVLYPNHFQRNAMVPANTVLSIPTDGAPWWIDVGGPVGVELVQVIASKTPLSLPEINAAIKTTTESSPFASIGRSADEFARDLSVQVKPPAGDTAPAVGTRNVLIRVLATASSSGTGPAIAATAALNPFSATLAVRPEKAVYKVGDPIRILVSSQKDCRLTLISVGAGGNVVRLFPNRDQTEDLIKSGQIVTVPAPQSSLQILAKAPAGVEGLVALCKPLRSADMANDQAGFTALGNIQTVGRELTAASAEPSDDTGEQASGSLIVVE